MRAKHAVILAVVCLQSTLSAETPLALNLRGVELFRNGQYAQSEQVFQASLAAYKAAPKLDVNGYAATLNNLAGSLLLQGKHRDAESPLRESVSLDEQVIDEPQIITSALNNLAILHEARGEFPQAIALLRRVLERPRLDAEDRAGVLHNIGSSYFLMGQHKKAKDYFEESLEITTRAGGTNDTPATLGYLAKIAVVQGEFERAKSLLDRGLDSRRKFHGDNHPLVALSLNDLAEYYRDTKQMELANSTFERSLDLLKSTVGGDHPHMAIVSYQYGEAKFAQGQYKEAMDLYQNAIRILETTSGSSTVSLGPIYKSAAACAAKLKRKQESKTYASRAKELMRAIIPYKGFTVDVSAFQSSK
jgi:tetratricopeptide (TPR) repeat protein